MANPFTITPAGGQLGQGLAGLGAIIGEAQQEKRALELQKLASDEMRAALESGDAATIADISLKYPQFANEIQGAYKIDSEEKRRQGSEALAEIAHAGTPGQAVPILQARIAKLDAEGRDSSQSQELLAAFQSEDPAVAQAAFDEAVNVEFPALFPEEFKLYRENIEPMGPKKDMVQMITDDGNFQTLFTDEQGNFTSLTGQPVTVPEGAQIVEGATFAGDPATYGLDLQTTRQLKDLESGTAVFADNAFDAMELLMEMPTLNTISADIAGLYNKAKAEFTALADMTGASVEDGDVLDINNPAYEDYFRQLGDANTEFKGLVMSLAYARAASRESGGRFSENDIKASLAELGANADPKAMAKNLASLTGRVLGSFETTYRVKTDKAADRPVINERKQILETYNNPPALQATDREAYDALPAGAFYSSGGQIYRKGR